MRKAMVLVVLMFVSVSCGRKAAGPEGSAAASAGGGPAPVAAPAAGAAQTPSAAAPGAPAVPEEDLAALHLPAGSQPQIGKDILCAVTVSAADSQRPHPTVDLFAPIVVNLKQKIGIQVVQTQYSAQHPLRSEEEAVAC